VTDPGCRPHSSSSSSSCGRRGGDVDDDVDSWQRRRWPSERRRTWRVPSRRPRRPARRLGRCLAAARQPPPPGPRRTWSKRRLHLHSVFDWRPGTDQESSTAADVHNQTPLFAVLLPATHTHTMSPSSVLRRSREFYTNLLLWWLSAAFHVQ